jgi:transposase
MDTHLFWFNDEQWAKIEPHLPTKQPGPQRKDDRLILSGIMHVLKVGCRWVDCPREYGPHKTGHVKAHRCASGGKGGPNFRRSGSPRAAATAKSTRSLISFSARGVDGWQTLNEKANIRRLISLLDPLTSLCWKSR